MNVYEMSGFLRGECLPGDLLVGEGTAAYLVRKLKEATTVRAERDALERQLLISEAKCKGYFSDAATALIKCDALAVENAEMRGVIDAAVAVADNSAGITGWHLNGEIAGWDEILPELNIETPATDAALAAIEARGVERAAEYTAHESSRAEFIDPDVYLAFFDLADDLKKLANELREGK